MLNSTIIPALTLLGLLWGCTAGRNSAADEQRARTLAKNMLGEAATISPNATADYYLCTSPGKERPGITSVRFFVFDATRDSVILEREIDNGSVKWHDTTQLLITKTPGAITGDEGPEAFREIVDLKHISNRR